MKNPTVAQAEVDAGRGVPLPAYVNEIGLARWLGITPWELQDAPLHWYQKLNVFIEAEHEAREAARGKK